MLENLLKIERRKVRIQSRHFALILDKFYRCGTDQILLIRCIGLSGVPKVLEATHDSQCEGYFVGMLTAQKTHRAGYYWPTMFKDVYEHARKCDSCERYSRKDVGLSIYFQPSLHLASLKNEILTLWIKFIQYNYDKWDTLLSQQSTWRSGPRRKQWRKTMLRQPPCFCTRISSLGLVVRRCWLVSEGHTLWIKWSRDWPRI